MILIGVLLFAIVVLLWRLTPTPKPRPKYKPPPDEGVGTAHLIDMLKGWVIVCSVVALLQWLLMVVA